MRDNLSAAAAGAIAARLDRLPATAAVWRILLLISVGFFFELYDLLLTGYVAPGLVAAGILSAKPTGIFSYDGAAGFVGFLFAGLFVGTIGCGVLADRFGRRPIFTVSLLWYTAANAAAALQTSAAWIDGWRFLAGLGLGVEMVTIGAYLSEFAPKRLRGRAFACCQAVGFCAVPIAALLAYLLVPRAPFGLAGWRWVMLIGTLAAAVVWWIRRGLPESPRWLAAHGRGEEADRIVAALEARVARQSGRALPPPEPVAPSIAATAAGFAEMWRPPYRRRAVMLIVFNIFQTVGFYGFATWLPTLLVARGVTVTSSLGYAAIIATAAPLGPLLALAFADRVERKHVIVAVAVLATASGLLLGGAASGPAIIALGVVLTLCNNVMSCTFHAYQQELFPTRFRARAVGFVYAWSRLSAVVTGFVIAATLDAFGVAGVFGLIAGAMAIVALAIGIYGPRTLGRDLDAIAT